MGGAAVEDSLPIATDMPAIQIPPDNGENAKITTG